MDLQKRKENLDSLAKQLAGERERSSQYNQRAGGFGDELNKSIRERDDTYRTLDNEVSTKRNSFYNTTETQLPQILAEYGDDPTLAFSNLGRARARAGAEYQNSNDIRNRKKQSIQEFVAELVRGAGLEAQKQRDNVSNIGQNFQMEESSYNRAFQEDQARRAEIARQQAFAEQQRQFNAQMAAQNAARAEAKRLADMQTKQKVRADVKGNSAGYIDDLLARSQAYAAENYSKYGQDANKLDAYKNNAAYDYIFNEVNQKQDLYGDMGLNRDFVKSRLLPTLENLKRNAR